MKFKMIALVTGASSGIGKDIAIELAHRKYNMIIVARDEEKLQALKKQIMNEENIKVYVKKIDVSSIEECKQLHNEVKNEFGAIDILVNNAGFGACGDFEEIALETEISMINTNIVGLHVLTKLFLKDMIQKNKGHILNVASIAGFMPGPLMTTYYSTKAYVVRFTQSIRQELFMKHSKVKISALCPGPVKTNFSKVANVNFSMVSQTSSWVAKYAVHKMLLNKILIFPDFGVWLVRLFAKILPEQLMAYFCYFAQKKKIKHV